MCGKRCVLSRTDMSKAASAFGTLELLKVITRYRSCCTSPFTSSCPANSDGSVTVTSTKITSLGSVRSLSRLTWRSLSL